MAVLKTHCPECNAPLKSPTGFAVGQTVCCPKCETYFAVEETDEKKDEDAPTKKPARASAADEADDAADAPKKKKRTYDEDEEPKRSYKDSPLRYAILGVLVVTMLVLGYFLIKKWQDDRELAKAEEADAAPVVQPRAVQPQLVGPGPGAAGGPVPVPVRPGNFGGPGGPIGPGGFGAPPNAKLPKNGKQPNVAGGAPAANPFGAILGGAPADAGALTEKFKTALVGTWTADLGNGATEELTYDADGTFTAKLSGPAAATASGKYTVQGLVGSKGLKIQLDSPAGPRTVTAVFEDDELQHPTLQPGVTGTFRKK